MFEKLQADYQRFQELEAALVDPAVTADRARLTTLAKERGRWPRSRIPYGRYLELGRQIAEAESLRAAETDYEMRSYAEAELEALRDRQQEVGEALRDLIYDQQAGADHAGLIVEIRAGTGGDEAALFVRDLLEMYHRFADQMGWSFEPLEMVPTELGGFREVSFGIKGEGAFRHLQFESGGHRVQRVPVTETQGRIHTSAATVAVLPEPEEVDIVIRPEDLQIDVMRSGGPGGQHQNKTESGVRITHLPDRDRRQLPRRAEPAQEQGQGDADPPQPALRPDRGEGPLRARPDPTDPDRLGRPLAADPDLQLPAEPRDRPPDRPDPLQPRPCDPGRPRPADDRPDRSRPPRAARRGLTP